MADLPVVTMRRAQPWLGTLVEIAADGADRACVEAGIEAAFAAIARVHVALSGHEARSELVQLNRTAAQRPERVSADLATVLALALDVAARSEGVFDPTIGGEVAAWGFLPRHGERAERASWRDVRLFDGCVRFARPLVLDFDGIAKGYAVDCAVAALAGAGVANACVNAGGDLRTLGPRGETVFVRTGGAQSVVMPLLRLQDAAVATSAYSGQRRSVGGRYATPLIDPRSRLPVMSTRTVSVVAPTCMLADALTKVVALRGMRAAGVLAAYGASATMLSVVRGRWRCTRLPRVEANRRAA